MAAFVHPTTRNALVLYGSETGNAQDAAEEVGRMTERLWFSTFVSDLDSVDLRTLTHYTIVILIVSTTGQGELPSNSRRFWKSLLRKKLPPNCLRAVHVAVFGLGDSSYPKFNWAARKVHKRLCQLGALELYGYSEADERHPEGHDASFLPWLVDLRNHLLSIYPLPEGRMPKSDGEFIEPKWKLRIIGASTLVDRHSAHGESSDESKGKLDLASSTISEGIDKGSLRTPPDDLLPIEGAVEAVLACNRQQTPASHWQDVRFLRLSTPKSASVRYSPGDVVTIYPKNFPDDVEALLSMLGWKDIADEPVEFVPNAKVEDLKSYPPPPLKYLLPYPKLTLRSLLLHYLDITAIPRRGFFANVAHFTCDKSHKERLLEFTNPELVDELYDYTTRPRRSILEVLEEFSTLKIPFEFAASIFPALRGRQFSIASGGHSKQDSAGNGNIELLVAIVKYQTVIRKIREGVCTRYLSYLREGTKINITIQKGGLNITNAEMDLPIVMIGPGTGVAPMRSLIWERHDVQERNADRHVNNKTVLFFGCRNENADFFFHDEWNELYKTMNFDIFTAFSRDQKNKVYVQDRIREQSALVYDLLHNQGGIVYICGSSGKMPQAVREALIEVLENGGNMDREAAEAELILMEKQSKYKQETW